MLFVSLFLLRVCTFFPPLCFCCESDGRGLNPDMSSISRSFALFYNFFVFAWYISTQSSSSGMRVYLLQITLGLYFSFPGCYPLLLYNVGSCACCTSTACRLSQYCYCCLLLLYLYVRAVRPLLHTRYASTAAASAAAILRVVYSAAVVQTVTKNGSVCVLMFGVLSLYSTMIMFLHPLAVQNVAFTASACL